MLRDLAKALRPEKPADGTALPPTPSPGFKPLTFREHRRCTVMPYRRRDGKYDTGVFDASGACIPETLLRRTYKKGREWPGQAIDFAPASSSHEGPAIYLGPLLDGFGHFLLESLARAWLAEQHPDIPLVWSCRAGQTPQEGGETGRLKSWQKSVLDVLGVRNPLICIDSPVRFERLIIPDIGYQIQTWFHPSHADFLAKVPHAPLPGRKLWLSRSRLDQLQNKSIPAVEDRLADLGWTIVHPQELSIPEQMAHIASAERIAGEQGSALHSIVLLDRPKDLRVDFFIRDPSREDGLYNKNYDTIAAGKGIRQKAIRIESEIVQSKKGKDVQKYSSNIWEYVWALGEIQLDTMKSTDAHTPMADLDTIAREFNTDKSSTFVNRRGEHVKSHDYCNFYEGFFSKFQNTPITILELGCGPTWNIGASLRMFQKYFPHARIIGVDNKPLAKRLEAEGFEIRVGDLADVTFVRSLKACRPTIIVDDASHIWSHQILSISELFDSLESNGIFIMEDINTSFRPLRDRYSDKGDFSGYDFVSKVCETLHQSGDDHLKDCPFQQSIREVASRTAFVAQYRHTALFVKRDAPGGARLGNPGI